MSDHRARGQLKVRFTDARLEGFPLPAIPAGFDRARLGALTVTYRDTEAPGLYCRVSPTGHKALGFAYRLPGTRRVRKVTLGSFPEWTVKRARQEVDRLRGAVATGRDPQGEREGVRAAGSVADLAEAYFTVSEGRIKPSTLALYRRLFRLHIAPAYGARAVSDVTPDDVERLAVQLKGTPTVANQCTRLASTLFRYAMRKRQRADNPAQFVPRYQEELKERYLAPEEVTRLLHTLDRAERAGLPTPAKHRRKPGDPRKRKHAPKATGPKPANPYAVAAVRFLLLTGMREQEALTLRWDAVDTTRRLITLEDSKTGRSVRPLSDAAAGVIAALPRIVGSPYVFPSLRDQRKPLKDITKLWDAVREAAGLEGVRLHDLRHTAASFMLQAGASLAEVQRTLGQRSERTTKRYAHISDAGAQSAASKLGAIVAALGDAPAGGAVAPIARHRSHAGGSQ